MPVLPPADSAVPALELLLGPEAESLLAGAAAAPGSQIEELHTTSVRYSPGRSVTAQYRATIRRADGSLDRCVLAASSGIPVPDGATVVVNSGDTATTVWRFPDDPYLPGLRIAATPSRAGALLARLGSMPQELQTRTRAYRAGRRAVVEAASSNGVVFMKVVRPSQVAALQQRHVDLAPHLPVPKSLGWSGNMGIVAMTALGGVTLRSALEAGDAEAPSPQAIISVLDQFPSPDSAAPEVRSAVHRAPEYARLLRAVLPTAAELLDRAVTGIGAAPNDEPSTAVHGDFHSSQLLVDSGRIVGLVDVDTAGVGQRADDLASMVAQLVTVTLVAAQPARLVAYNRALLEHFDRLVNPKSLRRRVAAAILGLATGPFRVQLDDWPQATQQRIEVALHWLEAAQSGDDPLSRP